MPGTRGFLGHTAWHPRISPDQFKPYSNQGVGSRGFKMLTQALLTILRLFKIFHIYSKQGQQQNKEVMSGLDSDDETDSDGTIDDKYNLCKEKGPSRRSLAIQSGCKVNRHYLLS